MTTTVGKRRCFDSVSHFSLAAGEYGKNPHDGQWYCNPPGRDLLGGLAKHEVIEHDDGTITVSPSILITAHDGEWHGYLERGVWRQV